MLQLLVKFASSFAAWQVKNLLSSFVYPIVGAFTEVSVKEELARPRLNVLKAPAKTIVIAMNIRSVAKPAQPMHAIFALSLSLRFMAMLMNKFEARKTQE